MPSRFDFTTSSTLWLAQATSLYTAIARQVALNTGRLGWRSSRFGISYVRVAHGLCQPC